MKREKQSNATVDPPRTGGRTARPGTRFSGVAGEKAGELDKLSDAGIRRELEERRNGSGE